MCCLTRSHPHAHNVRLSGGTLQSLGTPLDRFTMREVGKGGVRGGTWQTGHVCKPWNIQCVLCEFVCYSHYKHTHTCTFKLIKIKQNENKECTLATGFRSCLLPGLSFGSTFWQSSHAER